MRYWLTTHYPHDDPSHPWFLYIKREHAEVAKRIAVGDRVLFVELLGRDGRGLGGVKCVGTVSSAIDFNTHREPIPEVEGQFWQHKIECTDHDFLGRLSREELNVILGYAPGNPLRVKGGVLPLSAEAFENAYEAFKCGDR
jgi:hypothetical protein